MTLSLPWLTLLITLATLATAIAPIVLVLLWIRDIRKGMLW